MINLKWEPRQEQVEILERFKRCVNNKKKFYFVDSPVGTGKSYAIMMMAKWYSETHLEAKFDILTNTKILQDQYLRDFEEIKSLKGVENYFCSKYQCSCAEGDEINKASNQSCSPCEYKTARSIFLNSEVSLTNFHMFLGLHMYATEVLDSRKSNILFVDEAHGYEETYSDFVNVHVSRSYLQSLGVWNTDWDIKTIKTLYQLKDFLEKQVNPVILAEIQRIQKSIEGSPRIHTQENIDLFKIQKHLSRAKCKYNRFIMDAHNINSNWILQIDDDPEFTIKAEIVWGQRYLNEIWSRYEHVVFLSGTILDRVFFTKMMGVEPSEAEYISLDSPFAVENRKIIYKPVVNFSFANKLEAIKFIIPEIERVLEIHKNEKGIIHTANYEVARWVMGMIKNDRLITHDNKNREFILTTHLHNNKPTVLVSPSMMNGIDLRDDFSRFQVIAKVPFPNLSNEKVKRRMQTNSKWYQWKTLCDIVQACGRSVRNMNDYATTYIFDANFDNVLRGITLPMYLKKSIFKE
jgi:ATP-dependent DNA helicase DinG